MIGFSANSNSITGVSNANINYIKSDNINSSTYNGITSQNILYLNNLTGNVQQQFNNINTTLSTGGHIANLTIGTVTGFGKRNSTNSYNRPYIDSIQQNIKFWIRKGG